MMTAALILFYVVFAFLSGYFVAMTRVLRRARRDQHKAPAASPSKVVEVVPGQQVRIGPGQTLSLRLDLGAMTPMRCPGCGKPGFRIGPQEGDDRCADCAAAAEKQWS